MESANNRQVRLILWLQFVHNNLQSSLCSILRGLVSIIADDVLRLVSILVCYVCCIWKTRASLCNELLATSATAPAAAAAAAETANDCRFWRRSAVPFIATMLQRCLSCNYLYNDCCYRLQRRRHCCSSDVIRMRVPILGHFARDVLMWA